MIEEDGRQLLMEGSIDLLFEEEGGLVLVDYKTDKLKGRNPQDVAKDYELQMSRYAQAVEKTTQRKVQEMGIWLARSGEWMVIEINDK
jgi:ATP-dependent helicase/nuclease subunit A